MKRVSVSAGEIRYQVSFSSSWQLAQVLGETWENDYIHSLISRIDLNGDGVIRCSLSPTPF